ncbi:MAG: hypothetical protein AB1327_06520 [Bacillota bacterium]|uniref:hypothetical protein n=1 Tax=Desulforudis sp. DRI-14 TaxID=3459793 RepID=UPI0034840662
MVLEQAHMQAQRILEPVFTEILDELGKTVHMRNILCRLALDGRPYKDTPAHPSGVARTIDKLLEKGIVEKVTRGQYRV